MARPRARELTERELAIMHVFWDCADATAEEAREQLEVRGESLAYVTVANVIRGLEAKGVLRQLNKERPFRFRAAKTFEEVSQNLLSDLMSRLFSGSRQAMLVQLLARQRLSEDERAFLQTLLSEPDSDGDSAGGLDGLAGSDDDGSGKDLGAGHADKF